VPLSIADTEWLAIRETDRAKGVRQGHTFLHALLTIITIDVSSHRREERRASRDSRYLRLKGTPCVRVALVIFAREGGPPPAAARPRSEGGEGGMGGGGGEERTIGEECNRCFIDEAWVSKCRLLAENAGALSASAGPARGKKKARRYPRGPAGSEGRSCGREGEREREGGGEREREREREREKGRLLQINTRRDSSQSYLTLISRSNEFL